MTAAPSPVRSRRPTPAAPAGGRGGAGRRRPLGLLRCAGRWLAGVVAGIALLAAPARGAEAATPPALDAAPPTATAITPPVTTPGAPAAAATHCRVLIISGDPGRPVVRADATTGDWSALFDRWRGGWRDLFVATRHVPEAQVVTLHCPDPADPAASVAPAEAATHAHVLAALAALTQASTAQDQVVVVLIGHGYHSGTTARFCLPDTDLTDAEIAAGLAGLRCRQCILLALAPDLRDLDRTCAAPGRVIVLGNIRTSAPYFSEFLLRALTPGRSLLEAFNDASFACIGWYQHQTYLAERKAWQVDGSRNQELWRLFYPRGAMVPGPAVAGPVAVVHDPNLVDQIAHRRVIAEVAGLDDHGEGTPATVYDAGPDPAPLTTTPAPDGKPAAGAIAAHCFLGAP